MFWLGIDVGTGGTRALLVDEKGHINAGATAPHEDMDMKQPMWAEQRPDDWWEAARKAIRSVLVEAKVTGKDVRGVGLSGQMHGLVMLDAQNRVIRPALIWCDQRSQAQVDWINKTAGEESVLASTCNPVLTGFTLPKLLWVRDNEPAHYERLRRVLLPKDYVRYHLTGEYATDVSDASGTGVFDVLHRRWSNELADRLGVNRDILPLVYESSDISGKITEKAAELTGLEAGTPVAGGGGDQASSGVGNGIVEPGLASCTIGTSGVVFAHMNEPAYDPKGRVHTFCHAVRGKWHVMGVTQGAGLSLQWFRNNLAKSENYDSLTAEAERAPAGSQGLFWLPYLMGERTPHLDSLARAGWIGLTAKHTRADMIRSVIEGVSFSLKDCLDLIEQMGMTVNTVRVAGGGARSAFWRQVLADVFGKKVVSLGTQDSSAYGASLLAMVATREFASVPEACNAVVRETSSMSPRPVDSNHYGRAHKIYQSLYPALKPFYRLIEQPDRITTLRVEG